jgi:hypothetical protein
MRKLLLTTAIASATLVASNAVAQTTVTGSLSMIYKGSSIDAASDINGGRGFGRESQLNIQNKGKLNNGIDYAAGFALEFDGGQDNDPSNENLYIDFIFPSKTTITVGQDHIQNTNRTKGNFVGYDAVDVTDGANAAIKTAFIQSAGVDVAQFTGIGIVQNTSFGNLSFNYAPTVSSPTSTAGISNTNNGTLGAGSGTTAYLGTTDAKGISETNGEGSYEIGFDGNLGVKGLGVHYFYNESPKNQGGALTRDHTGVNYGVSYNMGDITAGYNRKETEIGINTTDLKQDEFGLAFAVSKEVTLGANYTKVDNNQAGKVDAKFKSISVGYNLGPVALTGQFAKVEAYDNVSTTKDMDIVVIRAVAAF